MQITGEINTLEKGWLNIPLLTGAPGTTRISVSSLIEHNGRVNRVRTIHVTTSKGTTKSAHITQTARGEFVLTNDEYKKAGDGESQIVITGSSNSQALLATIGQNTRGLVVTSLEISLDNGTTWTAVNNGANITDDPGEDDKYLWRLTLGVASNFAVTSGEYASVSVGGKNTGLGETIVRQSGTTVDDSSFSYDLGDSNSLEVTGTSNSASLTFGGTLANLSHTVYISFDNGATWTEYTEGTTLTQNSVARGEYYKYKVVFDTSTLSAESADMTLTVNDHANRQQGSSTVSFHERS